MLPDLQSLRCFEAAAVQGSFRAAANAVALSPAAFSDRIRRLEEDLGVVLFQRTTRQIGLTPAGEKLLPQARVALAEARRCVELAHDGVAPPFELTLGTRFELGMSWLIPALDPLAEARPERLLHLHFGDTPHLMAALAQGRVDAVVGSMRLTKAHLSTALLHEEGYRFVGTPSCQLRSWRDAERLALVDIGPELPLFRYWQDGVPASQVWEFAQIQYMGTIGAIRARVLAGAGVAVLPDYFVEADLEAGRLVELLPEYRPASDWFRLVWRSGHARERELRELAESLRALPLQ